MSGPFGWDYPPGCNSTPYDEAQALDITAKVQELNGSLPDGVLAVFWDEDGNIIEVTPVTIPADPDWGYPESTECQDSIVEGLTVDWDDDLSEGDNITNAADKYLRHEFL